MREHDWKQDADGAWSCENAGCTVRRAPDSGIWQRKKGAHWRRINDEPLPECKGSSSSPRTFEASLGMEEAIDATEKTKPSPLAKVRAVLDEMGNLPLPVQRVTPENTERVMKWRAAMAAVSALERALPTLMESHHYMEHNPNSTGAPRDWRNCPKCAALLEPK